MAAAPASPFFFWPWHLKLLTFLPGEFSSYRLGPAVSFRLSSALRVVPCLYSLVTALAPAAHTQTLGRSSALLVWSSEVPLHKHMESTHCLNDAARISASSPHLSGPAPDLLFCLLLTFSLWGSHASFTSEVLAPKARIIPLDQQAAPTSQVLKGNALPSWLLTSPHGSQPNSSTSSGLGPQSVSCVAAHKVLLSPVS